MRFLGNSRRAPKLMAPLALALMTGAGCDWTTFADEAAKAPVRSIGAPSGFKSSDFGRVLLPLSDGQGHAAAFVASSINDPNLVIVHVDPNGDVGTAAVPGTALDSTEDSPITSLAEVVGQTPPRLLLGTPKIHNQGYGRVYTYNIEEALDASVLTLLVPPLGTTEPGLGRGVAVGRLGGAEASPDYVIGSDDRLVVMVDGVPASSTAGTAVPGCDTAFDPNQDARYLVRRPLLAAHLWEDAGPNVEQLVTGTTHSGDPGRVSFFSVTGTAAPFALSCIAAVSAPAAASRASSKFGKSLASGDFNGDGKLDLLVGSPPQDAYVFLGPFPPGAAPAPLPVITDTSGVDFGFSVAALNVDGMPGDEALIGDPRAAVDGKEEAGRVTAYRYDPASMTMKPYKTYADRSPEANANYGSSVAALKFCATSPAAGTACPDGSTSRMLMVGAGNEVFLYYRVGELKRDGMRVDDVRLQ